MIILVMGVSGSGKTTVGRLLAEELGWPFYDGDDFHPEENVRKMASGIPLDDADRIPWLQKLNLLMRETDRRNTSAVIACSALKKSYRTILSDGVADLKMAYLKGDYQSIENRMLQRQGHYMKAGMLKSQFDALEESADLLTLNIGKDPVTIVAEIRAGLEV